MMKRLFFYSIPVVLLLFIALPYLIDWNARYSGYVFRQLGGVTLGDGSGIAIKSVGNITGSIILPKLTASDLYMECNEDAKGCSGVVSIDKLELKISLLSLLGREPSAHSIDITGLRTDFKSFSNMIFSQTSGEVGEVRINDSVIAANRVAGVASRKNAVHIKSSVTKFNGKASSTEAQIRVGKRKYSLSAKLDLSMPNCKVDVELSSKNTKMLLSGRGDKLDNLGWALSMEAGDLSELAQVASVITNNSVFEVVTSTEKVALAANIKPANDQNIRIGDLSVQSASVSGNAQVKCLPGSLCEVDINLDSVDLDTLIRDNSGSDREVGTYTTSSFSSIPPGVNIRVSLDIQKVIYRKNVSRNLVADTVVRNGQVIIERLLLDLPGHNNHLSINGISEEGGAELTRFLGNVSAQGDDFGTLVSWLAPISVDQAQPMSNGGKFYLESGLYIAPRIFALSGIKMIASGAHLSGNLKYARSGREGAVIGNISAREFSIDGYELAENFDIKNDIMTFSWLRGIACPIRLSVQLRDFILKSRHIQSLSFILAMSNRGVSVDKIHFSAEDKMGNESDLEGRARVTLSSQGVKPRVSLNLKSKQYSSDFMWIPGFFVEGSTTDSNTDSSKASSKKIMWSNKPMGFSALEGVDGNIEVHVQKLRLGKRVLSDLVWFSTLKEGVTYIDKLHFAHGKGSVDVKGNIGMEEVSSLSLVLSLTNLSVNAEEGGSETFKGNVSVSGSISTRGRSLIEWANSMQGKVKFAIRGLMITGIDLNTFIRDLFNADSKSEIASLAHVHLYKGSTIFREIDGASEINIGTATTSMRFNIDNAAGSASVNFSIPQLTAMSLFRFFFIPPGGSGPVHMDMNLQGYVWQPNISFDVDRLYEIVRRSR